MRLRFAVAILLASVAGIGYAQDANRGGKKGKKGLPVWMVPEHAKAQNPDFNVQGEYVCTELGAQVIALDKGCFQAVLLPGGLPGAGWNKKDKILVDGKTDGAKTTFVPAKGPKKYLDSNPMRFSAASKFPPTGQKPYNAVIQGDIMTVTTDAGKKLTLRKTLRKSPTLGMKPPAGATVLFDGKNRPALTGGTVTDRGTIFADKDKYISTRKQYSSYILHVEFMTCFTPGARGQSRGNSGCFQATGEEVQVLDSFGLEGMPNEAGGIYKWCRPEVNMAFPPLTWQTYDIEFVGASNGQPPKMTVRLNGVVIHNKRTMKKTTPQGNLRFQQHKDFVQYRNMWVIDKKPDLDPTTSDQ